MLWLELSQLNPKAILQFAPTRTAAWLSSCALAIPSPSRFPRFWLLSKPQSPYPGLRVLKLHAAGYRRAGRSWCVCTVSTAGRLLEQGGCHCEFRGKRISFVEHKHTVRGIVIEKRSGTYKRGRLLFSSGKYTVLEKGETHRYDDIKPLVDQFPLVKTGKPAVKRIIMQNTRATGVENSKIKNQRSDVLTEKLS